MSDRDRFDKFTERARKVLSLAQEEAQRFHHNHIGTEHLLLGLFREGSGLAARVLQGFGVNLEQVRSSCKTLTERDTPMKPGGIGLTADAKRAIEMAVEEARRLNHHYLGTEHELLGLLRVEQCTALKMLELLKIDPAEVRSLVLGMISRQPIVSEHASGVPPAASPQVFTGSPTSVPKAGPSVASSAEKGHTPFDKFNEQARKVLSLAQEEAQRFHHNYIGTEHLLLGLVRQEESVASTVLRQLGIELEKVRRAVEFIIGQGDHVVLGEIGLTPRAKKVIELAVDEALRLRSGYIGAEHLLLGLLSEGSGIGTGVLESLGVRLEQTHAEVVRLMNEIKEIEHPED